MKKDLTYNDLKKRDFISSGIAVIFLFSYYFTQNRILGGIGYFSLTAYYFFQFRRKKQMKNVIVDEMSKENQLKAGNTTFEVLEAITGIGLIVTFLTDTSISFDYTLILIVCYAIPAIKDGLYLYYENEDN